MARYQITLVVDVEATNAHEAIEVGEALEQFLGLHHWTDSQGCVTEITELDEEVTPLIPDEEYMGLA